MNFRLCVLCESSIYPEENESDGELVSASARLLIGLVLRDCQFVQIWATELLRREIEGGGKRIAPRNVKVKGPKS